MSEKLIPIPLELSEANAFVEQNHRHHGRVVGHKFSLGAAIADKIVGVVICGRPIARMEDDGFTIEILRCATDGTPNACSFLYRASWRVAKEMGYRRGITRTLDTEGGASLRGAGWLLIGSSLGGSWSRPSRPRIDKHPLQGKLLWEVRE
jgi:hypothetical protein